MDPEILSNYCINENETIEKATKVINENLSRCVVVINNNEKVIGVFSEGDILRAIMQRTSVFTPLKNILEPKFMYLTEKDLIKAFELIKKYGITLIPIIDKNFKLIDVITLFDVLNYLEKKSI